MSTWLSIFLAIVIWVVVTLSAVAIFQINGMSTKVWPNFVGLIAVGIFLIIMRGRSQAESGENQAPIQGLRARSTDRTHNSKDPRAFTPQDEEQTQQANTINATEGNGGGSEEFRILDGWSQTFKILNEYDEVVKYLHGKLDILSPQLSHQFRAEVISDRNLAGEIFDRLMAEHERKLNPYPTDLLNGGLLEAKSLGRDAEEEFIRVVEVMGVDVNVESVLRRLEEKYGRNGNAVSYRGYNIIKNTNESFNVLEAGVPVKGSLDYSSLKLAKAYIDHLSG
jgi:hypothetical protein